MAWSKAISKGTSENKLIESTDADKNSNDSTTSGKSVQSTNPRNIKTTNNDASDNKSKSLSNGGSNLLSRFLHSSSIDYM